ncbi:MAG: magnesium transporter CorA family protein [Gammaproteobacteria bacterium]|nr:magnesium transporter CorA family protein [Gammaproteobacteria bacterium]
MIHAYILEKGFLRQYSISKDNCFNLKKAIWIDLLSPTAEDEKLIESTIYLDIPARDDMREIEVSSRLYKKNNALFMTAPMLVNSESKSPFLDAVSFILTKTQLVTVRYFDLKTFTSFISRVNKKEINDANASRILIFLLETAIDRIADILERVGASIDTHSQVIFRQSASLRSKINSHEELLQEIGSNGDLASKARESLVSFNRLVSYFKQNEKLQPGEYGELHLVALAADIQSLSDHVGFLSHQISFLLNATLGMININQSNIIKIFSITGVIFLPPTVVASVYGMNFEFMPELQWHYGFAFAIGVMFFSALLPYQFFKWKKWL